MKTNYLKKALIGIAILTAGLVNVAQADCVLRGYAVRVATFEGKTFMYFRPNFGTNYYYLGFTRDPFVSDAMYQGFRGKTRLFVQSNASSCPAVGGQGEKVIGDITIVGLGY